MCVFNLILIKPTNYCERGYPLHWQRSYLPANTLATLNGLAEDAAKRRILGESVSINITPFDESSQRIKLDRLITQLNQSGERSLVCLVGVQTNQYPRAMELARKFRAAEINVALGGFHVSGCIAMLKELPPELADAQSLGVGLFAGEAEDGRLDEIIIDAYHGRLKPLYDYSGQPPQLTGQPVPMLDAELVRRTNNNYSSFDLGRGCPFTCSFCTIINVQGRKSRFRSADDLERIIREGYRQGIDSYFITDDNLARNKNWEACLDRLIALRGEGIKLRLMAQVDVKSHRVPRFIDKAVAAGVDQIFVGIESVSSENLAHVDKRQNNIHEYRKMMLAWKQHPVVIIAGYIIGFPADTPESIDKDIEVLKQQLPIDTAYFSYLTPLPGSVDHKLHVERSEWINPDLNLFNLNNPVTQHPHMSEQEWRHAYNTAWNRFYTPQHMETVLKRMVALGSNKKLTTLNRLVWYGECFRLYNIHPLEGGVMRILRRADRRPGLPKESWGRFALYWMQQCVIAPLRLGLSYAHGRMILKKVMRDPRSKKWRDEAISDN